MIKKLSSTTKIFAGLIILVLFIMVILISISGNKASKKQNQSTYINDSASADNKVEALKTMTADLLAVENKNALLQKSVEDIKAQDQQAVTQIQKTVSSQVQQALQQLKNQNAQKQDDFESNLRTKQDAVYPINDDDNNDSFVWVSDMSQSNSMINASNVSRSLPLSNKQIANVLNNFDHTSNDNSNISSDSLLHQDADNDQSISLKQSGVPKVDLVKPKYTIPINATLTGATLMTPLVGRVPIDGKLPSPYSFKLVLSATNLTANGYPLPGVKGAVMSGIASGDMLGSCARGDIKSITFIFNDGRISTTEAQNDSDSLGYISSQTGNPCINGQFHSNAAVFLGAQMGLAGAQGYANAITNSQYMNSVTPDGGSVSALVGSANRAAIGSAGSSAAQAAQTWWNQRVKDSFDYVYVPNIDPKTNKPMKIVVNISKEIHIDYNNNARKVDYESDESLLNSQLD